VDSPDTSFARSGLELVGLGPYVTQFFSAAARGDFRDAGDDVESDSQNAVFEQTQQQQQQQPQQDDQMAAADSTTYDL
jgi:hypothetical protein